MCGKEQNENHSKKDFKPYLDSASDASCYLEEARHLILEDKTKLRYYPLVHAAFCRLLAIEIISNIELLINQWAPESKNANLKRFLKKKPDNIEKICIYRDEFEKSGILPDPQVLIDYTATKLIRNAVIHSGMSEKAEKFLLDNGFPTDVSRLAEEHWDWLQCFPMFLKN